MTSEDLHKTRKEAEQLMEDEALRTNAGFRHMANQQTTIPPQQQQPFSYTPQQQQVYTPYAPFGHQAYQYTQPLQQAHQPTFSYNTTSASFVPPAPPVNRPPPTTDDERDAAALRAQLPAYFNMYSDKYILAQASDTIYRLIREEKMAENSKTSKTLEAKQHQNFLQAAANPVTIPEAQDNRSNLYHPGRALAGAAVTVQTHWHNGRQTWGAEGVPATSNYDCDAVGIAGCVTSRGWEALHHPGSGELSIKLFTVNNMVQSGTGTRTVSLAGEDGLIIKESWREVQSIEELKKALDTIVTASSLCSSWNFSYKVLETFMRNNEWFEKDLTGYKRAQILSDFCDHIFKLNADAYIRNADFHDGPKLQTVWANWWGSRRCGLKPSTFISSSGNQRKGAASTSSSNSNSDSRAKSDPNKVPFMSPSPKESAICKRFSEGTCTRKHFECIIRTKVGPRRLYHLCAGKKKDSTGAEILCLGQHSKKDHK